MTSAKALLSRDSFLARFGGDRGLSNGSIRVVDVVYNATNECGWLEYVDLFKCGSEQWSLSTYPT